MKKLLFFILLLQFLNNGCVHKNIIDTIINDYIAVLPFNNAGYSVSGTESIKLNDNDIVLIESLLKEFAREFNDKNEYPYIQINLEQCYRQYYPYLFTSRNIKYVKVWLFSNIPNNLNWHKDAINGSYGDHFSVQLNITEQLYRYGEFVPGRDISRLISSNNNRIIYTMNETDEPIIYSIILNAINEDLGGNFNFWNINRNINLMDNVDIRRSAREMALWLKRNRPSIDDNLLDSFIENNSQFYSFNERVNILQENMKWKWHESRNSHKESYVVFSRIGYNIDKTNSFVYVGCYFGDISHGLYYFLEKENKAWKIKYVIPGWIS